jgi:copper(I)-binding protein
MLCFSRTIRTAAIAALSLAITHPLLAHDYKLGNLHIDHPWARPTPGSAKNGAAYFVIRNNGQKPDVLIAAGANVSERIELHEHINDNGVMKMREVAGGIRVGAGETVKLEPGGYHVMFLGLKQPLKEGEQFPLSLTFKEAGTVEVMVKVEQKAGKGSHGHHH